MQGFSLLVPYDICKALPERNSLSKLWVRQISFHSARTFCNPRSRNRRILICRLTRLLVFLLPGGHVQVDTLDPRVSHLLRIPVAVVGASRLGLGTHILLHLLQTSAPIAACRCSAASPPPPRSPALFHPPRSARCSLAGSCPCGSHRA